jgi:hypothetical protein
MFTHNLVPEHDGRGATEVSVGHVNVAVTHATGNNLDYLFAGTSDRNLAFLGDQGLVCLDQNH